MENHIKTSHNLDFLVAPWYFPEWKIFKIGTCRGLWNSTEKAYQILAIDNDEPRNGHFEDVLEWFEFACKRDKKDLVFVEIWNQRFLKHLTSKRGFKKVVTESGVNARKRF